MGEGLFYVGHHPPLTLRMAAAAAFVISTPAPPLSDRAGSGTRVPQTYDAGVFIGAPPFFPAEAVAALLSTSWVLRDSGIMT